MPGHLERLCEQVVADRQRMVKELSVLSGAEEQQIWKHSIIPEGLAEGKISWTCG